ncbi:OmpA family protein [Mucilaginibacter terrenus]|uniref:OmpA family protein n=1 Tax=Mucilaginibacter terrenus TaxID=2482727 RepID=A0A3E2NTE0_9SPHI|nr:OmpA family protein [Mucilaginibacter terrenus]RFZ84276.1 OmpA family protein [Mucilaginibacter terrenus]
MAHLEVKPKSSSPWWLWLLITLIALALVFFLVKGCGSKNSTNGSDSTATSTDTTSSSAQPVAATEPDWNSVDFNSPKTSDPDITDSDIAVSGNDKYTIYSLGENILFGTDKNQLEGSAESKLKQIATSINKRFKGATIGVYGNTDSTGDAGHNKQLGADRANAVKDWLLKSGGIDAGKVSVHSLGETKPVASNATASGREQNRNVEIVAFPDSTGTK